MESLDWKMISVGFNVIQFVSVMVVFMVIKFNDIAHIEKTVKEIKDKQNNLEVEQKNRHIENIKSISDLSIKVSEMYGRFITLNKKDE